MVYDGAKNRCVACPDPAWDISGSPAKIISLCLVGAAALAILAWSNFDEYSSYPATPPVPEGAPRAFEARRARKFAFT